MRAMVLVLGVVSVLVAACGGSGGGGQLRPDADGGDMCSFVLDCDIPVDPCKVAECAGHACNEVDAPDGASCPAPAGMAGRCVAGKCDVKPWSCAEQCPPASPAPCRIYSCQGTNGDVCVGEVAPDATPCGDGKMCLDGLCVQPCAQASDCARVECRDAHCLLGVCSYFTAPDGRTCEPAAGGDGTCVAGSCAAK